MNIAVILASGQGKRMQAGKNKVLLEIDGRPLVYYSIEAFQDSVLIDSILLVCKKEEIGFFQKIVDDYNLDKVGKIIEGGAERQDSASNAVFYLDKNLEEKTKEKNLILFHNGANPFITEDEIKRSIKEAGDVGACVVAHPTKDTVKKVDDKGLVIKTLDRKELWNMQTPQTIELDLAKRVFGDARDKKFIGTDDVSLVERLGEKVKVIQGSEFNFKITTPIDLELAKLIYKNYFQKNV